MCLADSFCYEVSIKGITNYGSLNDTLTNDIKYPFATKASAYPSSALNKMAVSCHRPLNILGTSTKVNNSRVTMS